MGSAPDAFMALTVFRSTAHAGRVLEPERNCPPRVEASSDQHYSLVKYL